MSESHNKIYMRLYNKEQKGSCINEHIRVFSMIVDSRNDIFGDAGTLSYLFRWKSGDTTLRKWTDLFLGGGGGGGCLFSQTE